MSEREAEYHARSTKPAVKRAVRLVWIRDLLFQKPRTVGELAMLCGVASSTIYRDIADLQGEPLYAPLIVNIVWGEEGSRSSCD